MSKDSAHAIPLLPTLAVALVAGAGGWMLGRLQAPAAGPVQATFETEPAIATAGPSKHLAAAGAVADPLVETPGFPPYRQYGTPGPDAVIAALQSGDDAARTAALESALAYDIGLPPEVLADVYEHAGDEELRLLAFTTHIDSLATDVEAARSVMQAATGNTSAGVRAEAERRLGELAAYELQLMYASSLSGSPP